MFSNERARSGIIVLPCGAGKTLVGITAACTIKKSILILSTGGVSCEQWKTQLLMWGSVGCKIVLLTSKSKDKMFDVKKEAGIVISTYTMISFQGDRSNESA